MVQKGGFEEQKVFRLEESVIFLQIAVCDDERIFLDQLKKLLYDYSNTHRLELVVDEYQSGEQLLRSSDLYDIIFMDYQLPGANGLETAQELRKRHNHCVLIFVTNYPDFVYDAFSVETFRFLCKPITKQMVCETMDAYFAHYGNDYPILLRSNYFSRKVETRDIVFLEASRKHCLIHTPKEVIEVNGPMAAIEAMLPSQHFFRIHKAYIINFNYVIKISHNEVHFTTGETAYLSRTNSRSFEEAFRSYIKMRIPEK